MTDKSKANKFLSSLQNEEEEIESSEDDVWLKV